MGIQLSNISSAAVSAHHDGGRLTASEAIRLGRTDELPKDSQALAELLSCMLEPSVSEDERSALLSTFEAQLEAQLEENSKPLALCNFSNSADCERIRDEFFKAVSKNDREVVRCFLIAGFNPDFKRAGMSMLTHAAASEVDLDVFYLIQACTEGPTDPDIPLHLRARHLASPELLEQYPLSENQYRWLHTKAIAHFYNIEGHMPVWASYGEFLSNQSNYEGHNENFINPYLSAALREFQQSSFLGGCKIGTGFNTLKEAFRELHRPGRPDQEVADKVQKGELCFVNTGWENHLVTICFFDGYMAICNRGSGASDEGTLKVFKINREKVTARVLADIRDVKYDSRSSGRQALYQLLPRTLEGTQDELCQSFNSVAPKKQKSGNCTLASPKAAIRFAWIMLLREQGVDQPLEVGRSESKRFTDFAARFVVERYASQTVPGFRISSQYQTALKEKTSKMKSRLRWQDKIQMVIKRVRQGFRGVMR